MLEPKIKKELEKLEMLAHLSDVAAENVTEPDLGLMRRWYHGHAAGLRLAASRLKDILRDFDKNFCHCSGVDILPPLK